MSDLIKTLRDALRVAIREAKDLERTLGRCEKRKEFLSQVVSEYESTLRHLSTPDALIWELLDEMAADKKVEKERVNANLVEYKLGKANMRIRVGVQGDSLDYSIQGANPKEMRDLILCLARAIREQESLEADSDD